MQTGWAEGEEEGEGVAVEEGEGVGVEEAAGGVKVVRQCKG